MKQTHPSSASLSSYLIVVSFKLSDSDRTYPKCLLIARVLNRLLASVKSDRAIQKSGCFSSLLLDNGKLEMVKTPY